MIGVGLVVGGVIGLVGGKGWDGRSWVAMGKG